MSATTDTAALDITAPCGDVLDQGNARVLLDLGINTETAGFAIGWIATGLQESIDELLTGRAGEIGRIVHTDPAVVDALTQLRDAIAISWIGNGLQESIDQLLND